MQNHDAHNPEPFGPVIYAYTRSQAVADGQQVDVTKIAQEAGILEMGQQVLWRGLDAAWSPAVRKPATQC